MQRVIYGSGGGEATDIAIKTARHTRQRRKIVSIRKGYHGHTGLAVATDDQRYFLDLLLVAIAEHGMLSPGERVLVAVSGGTASPCGTSSLISATRPTGSTSGSASASTARSRPSTRAASQRHGSCRCS